MLMDATTAMAGAWLIVVALAIPSPDAGLRQPVIGWCVLTAGAVAWGVCLLVRWAPRWVFLAIIGAGLIVLAAFTAPEYWSGAGPVMATWAKMAAVSSAPLLRERPAIALIVSLNASLGITLVVVGTTESITSGLAWRGGMFAAVAAVALGMAAVGIVEALRRVAKESDDAASDAQDASAAEAHDQARRDEADRYAAVIHDGLINTLGAVARGSGERNLPLTIERCRTDATAMNAFLSTERRLGPRSSQPRIGAAREIADQARRRARLLGLELAVSAEGDGIAIPDRIVAAICSLVNEALLNVAKHSGTSRANVRIAGGADRVRVEILDEGRGFDLVTKGQPRGIADRCRRLGIDLTIETSPDSGASVRLDWQAPDRGRPVTKAPAPRSMPLLERAHRHMVRWLCGWILGLFIAQTIASWGLAPPAGNLVALALIVPICLIAVRWADLGRRLPPLACGYFVLTAGLVTFTSAAGAAGCARLEIAWWGGTAGCLCLMLLMLLSSGRWIVAGLASYVLGATAVAFDLDVSAGTPSTCGPWTVPPLLLEAVVILLVIYLIRPLTARHARAAAKWRLDARRTRQRMAGYSASEEIRQQRGDQALAPALTLLDSIAAGALDPADPATEAACALEERYLRSLIALDPDLLELGDVLAEAVRVGRESGVAVAIDSGEPVDLPNASDLPVIQTTLNAILEHSAPGATVRLALFPEASGGRLTIVSDQRLTLPAAPATAGSTSLMLADLSDEDVSLIEIAWQT